VLSSILPSGNILIDVLRELPTFSAQESLADGSIMLHNTIRADTDIFKATHAAKTQVIMVANLAALEGCRSDCVGYGQ
jgi:hypothetical protein